MRRIAGTIVVCLLALGLAASPIANTELDESAPPVDAPRLPELGPIKAIAHIYAPDMDANAKYCNSRLVKGDTVVGILPSQISAAPGVQFDVPTVTVTVIDFDGNGFLDTGTRAADKLWLVFRNTGCDIATSGDLAMTVTGTLTNGDTFTIDILVP
ncbi:MAG: hypothetical protein GY708_10165 [Actinomycetia bacterium]|nr:hypothetical protein [Actinomycetes bacterium]